MDALQIVLLAIVALLWLVGMYAGFRRMRDGSDVYTRSSGLLMIFIGIIMLIFTMAITSHT